MQSANFGLKRFIIDHGLLITLFLTVAAITIASPVFLSYPNVINILRQISVLGIVSLGMTIVIISGYIDLSVGSTLSVTGIIAVLLQGSVGVAAAALIAVVSGVLIGILNGLLVVGFRASNGESLMLTFGTQTMLQAAALLLTGGYTLRILPGSHYTVIGQGFISVFPVPVLLFLFMAVALDFCLRRLRFGRYVYLVGANGEASRLAGIRVRNYKIAVYAVAGGLAAAGAIILTSRTNGATPVAGSGYELDAIMAVVIGGTSLAGGRGSIAKTVMGVVIIGLISNALNIIGVSPYNQSIFKGVIITAAVWLDSRSAALGAATT
jgi:ribose/xylose/arabinose/galactoside ABC-type transport system permease subunit